MEIDIATVERVAGLAKLALTDTEKENMRVEMSRIVSYFETLNKVDTSNVEPLVFMVDEVNVFGEDEAKLTISRQEALMNAPSKNSDYFKVPKVIERE